MTDKDLKDFVKLYTQWEDQSKPRSGLSRTVQAKDRHEKEAIRHLLAKLTRPIARPEEFSQAVEALIKGESLDFVQKAKLSRLRAHLRFMFNHYEDLSAKNMLDFFPKFVLAAYEKYKDREDIRANLFDVKRGPNKKKWADVISKKKELKFNTVSIRSAPIVSEHKEGAGQSSSIDITTSLGLRVSIPAAYPQDKYIEALNYIRNL